MRSRGSASSGGPFPVVRVRAAFATLCLIGFVWLQAVAAFADPLRRFDLFHDAQPRHYISDASPATEGPRPLVLVLHGGGGSADLMARYTDNAWGKLGKEAGWVVVYPSAWDGIWDTGGGRVSERRGTRIDDLGFLAAVIDDAEARFNTDPERIFVTGMSRGGHASFLLACKLPGRIRAIASVAMPLPEHLRDDCETGPPVGLMQINGTEDAIVPYDGGVITIRGQNRDRVLSTDETARLWRTRNGCGEAHSTTSLDKKWDRTSIERRDWEECAGAPVVTIRVEGGGHTWPGAGHRPVLGRTSREIDAARVAYEFFSRF